MRVFDALTQGIETAAEKIAAFSRSTIEIESRGSHLINIAEAGSIFGAEDVTVYGIRMILVDKPSIQYLMLVDEIARMQICQGVMGEGKEVKEQWLDSILQEFGNIFGTAIANTLSRILDQPIKTRPPEVVSDMAGAVLSSSIHSLDLLEDDFLSIDILVKVKGEQIGCRSFLFMDENYHLDLSENVVENPDVKEEYSE